MHNFIFTRPTNRYIWQSSLNREVFYQKVDIFIFVPTEKSQADILKLAWHAQCGLSVLWVNIMCMCDQNA